MRRFFIITIAASAVSVLVGCDKQRDLYVVTSPEIRAEGDWKPSLQLEDMTMNATALAYNGTGAVIKEYFFAPRSVTLAVDAGTYDVMLFNGLMYSPNDTHLDDVYFRGTESLATFEAVAAEGVPNKRLGRADGEYIASNKMEIITSAVQRETVDGQKGYYIKYKDGKNYGDAPSDYVAAELKLTPVAMSYKAQVVVTMTNIKSAYGADASLKGFVGSAFMATRRPSHFYVTHQFNLNSKKIIDKVNDIGTVESPVFVTFGPPLDVPEHRYEVYLKVMLVNGDQIEQTFDVTDQIASLIEALKAGLDGTGPIQHRLELPLKVGLTLPEVEPIAGNIGVDQWADDEVITVPIRP